MGRIVLFEFDEKDSVVFDEIMEVIKCHSDLEFVQIKSKEEEKLAISELEIFPEQRKVYYDRKEVILTPKEYDILTLFMNNNGRVLTYDRIYESVWGEDVIGNEVNSVRCHVRNLREKLQRVSSELPLAIRCVREVGYCFNI